MPSTKLQTWYDVLNVSPQSTDADVRRAYLILAQKWHPDRNPSARKDAEQVFGLVCKAYAVLKTAPQRRAYNHHLRTLHKKPAPQQKAINDNKITRTLNNIREIIWPLAPRGETRHG